MNVWKVKTKPASARGFSSMEIIVVVVMFLIVALLAISSFRQQQVRSNVAKTKSAMRSLATPLAAYYVDNFEYPAMAVGAEGANAPFAAENPGAYRICTFRLPNNTKLQTLTTPLAYLTSYPADPFADTKGATFGYRPLRNHYLLFSYGPDRDENTTVGDHYLTVAETKLTSGVDLNFEPSFKLTMQTTNMQVSNLYRAAIGTQVLHHNYLAAIGLKGAALHYDPTNGAFSEGDLVHLGGPGLYYDPTNGTTSSSGPVRIKK